MYDLATFRARVRELSHRATPYDQHHSTQRDLAAAVNLSLSELSRRLNGTRSARLTTRDIHAIVRVLTEWGAIATRLEAEELLALVDCPSFSEASWQSPPLDTLRVVVAEPNGATPSSPATAPVRPAPPPHNLPAPLTSFIGREQELTTTGALLANTRLLTLTGSGGCGKTRLALELAARNSLSFPDGIYLVELAAVHDAVLLPSVVAAAIGCHEQAAGELLSIITAQLANKRLLLILDNCEHLIEAVALFVHQLLIHCPALRILVTSREVLHLQGEIAFRVPSLSLPPADQPPAALDLTRYEATRLFVERIAALQPGFRPDLEARAAIRTICTQLDGIPLAIELAAARTPLMSLKEIVQQLDNRFNLLTAGYRATLPRQQTLKATVDWSYDFLTSEEQSLLRQLAVFSGGFDFEAVRAIAASLADEWRIIEQLGHLVDKSLVQRDEQNGITRYRLLETIRQYAAERLAQADEQESARQRHSQYYQDLACRLIPNLNGAEQAAILATLERDHDNIRAALSWLLDHQPMVALAMVGQLWLFWYMLGHLTTGRSYLEAALARVSSDNDDDSANGQPTQPLHPHQALVAAALNGAGVMAWGQADYVIAVRHLEKSLALRRNLADLPGVAQSLHNLGNVASDMGDYASAHAYYSECLTLNRGLDDKFKLAAVLANLAATTFNQGDLAAARPLYEESLSLMRQLGNKWCIATSLHNLAELELAHQNYVAASDLFNESLLLMRELGNRRGIASVLQGCGAVAIARRQFGVARAALAESLTMRHDLGDKQGIVLALEDIAALAVAEQRMSHAVRLFAATDALRVAIAYPLQQAQCRKRDGLLAVTRTHLSPRAWSAAWAAGQATSLDEAVSIALASAAGDSRSNSPDFGYLDIVA